MTLASRKKQNITRKATAELGVPEAASLGKEKSIERQAQY